jgi:cytochrome c oxidase cbb3-type subunit 2
LPHIDRDLTALRDVGVPYSDDDVKKAVADVLTQGDFGDGDKADLAKRYPGAQSRDYDGNPGRLTEMDALVAYLQMLGTQVDFKKAAARETAK